MDHRIDEGRHSDASYRASLRLLWSHHGRPTAWLLVLVAACTLVFIKSAEVHQTLSCGPAPTSRVTALPAPHRDANPDELRRRPGGVLPPSC
jgi:hypothetical protein